MRKAFISALEDLAGQDKRIVLLTGDLGFAALEGFRDKFPKRYFNVGVAEQNAVGMATGLAEAGFIPFIYSISTFASLRAYEFLRNGPLVHKLPVRVLGIGGGFEYGVNGITHYGLEDIALMRIQPGMTVVAPADQKQARAALWATWNLSGPVYYRLAKDVKPEIPGLKGRFKLGRAETIHSGSDALIITMGNITSDAVLAVDQLKKQGITCSISVVSNLTSATTSDLIRRLSRFRLIFTLEAHYTTGALASVVSEAVAQNNLNCRVIPCGIKDAFDGVVGSKDFLHTKNGISANALVARITASHRKWGSKRHGKS